MTDWAGPQPPNDMEVERAVLGMLLLASHTNEDIEAAAEQVDEPLFYHPPHRTIYKAVIAVMAETKVDLMSVTNKLKEMGELVKIGGAGYLTGLTNHIFTDGNLKYSISILRASAMRRGLLKLSTWISDMSVRETTDPSDLLEKTRDALQGIESIRGNGVCETGSILPALHARREAIASGKKAFIESGLDDLDEMMSGGFPTGYTVVIKGGSGQGKTALLLQILDQMVNVGHRILLISLEMRREDVWPRVIGGRLFRCGKVDTSFNYSCLWNTGKWIAERPEFKSIENDSDGWYIDDRESMSPTDIIQTINYHIREYGIDVVAIDHLNLVSHSFGHTQQDKELFCEQMRALAKEKSIVLIQLLQIQVKDNTVYYYKTAGHMAAIGLSVNMTSDKGAAEIELFKCRFGLWGKRSFHFYGGAQTFTRTDGGGFHVPEKDYLDGPGQGGDHKTEGRDNTAVAIDDRESGQQSIGLEAPPPVDLDEDVDFL